MIISKSNIKEPKEGVVGSLTFRNFRLLPPHDRVFYDLFDAMAAKVCAGSDRLNELFESEHPGEVCATINALEAECDAQVRLIFDQLERSHHPPYDRDYISDLAHWLDEAMDCIDRAATRYTLYKLPSSDESMRKLAGIIRMQCQNVRDATALLRKRQNATTICITIHDLEAQADAIYHAAIAERFDKIRIDERRFTELIAGWSSARSSEPIPVCANCESMFTMCKEYTRHVSLFPILLQVYEALEKTTDACEHVATILTRMVANNA